MIVIEKFAGLITNASPYALPGGACVSQVNMQCLAPGQLQGRGGLESVRTLLGRPQIVSIARVPVGSGESVVCQAGTAVEVVTL